MNFSMWWVLLTIAGVWSFVETKSVCNEGHLKDVLLGQVEKIENFYRKILDDLEVLREQILLIESENHFENTSISEFKTSGRIQLLYDKKNDPYYGDRRPDRDGETMIPLWSLQNMYNNSVPSLDLYESLVTALVSAPRSARAFCEVFFSSPTMKYLPVFCRYPDLFLDDMIEFELRLFEAMRVSVRALVIMSPVYSATYIATNRGLFLSEPATTTPNSTDKDDWGSLLGANFTWPTYWYGSPAGNPSLKSVYSPPYQDYVNLGFIVSAFVPVYFGNSLDAFWGLICTDIHMNNTLEVISSLDNITNSSFALLVNDNSTVILGSPQMYETLFSQKIGESNYLSILDCPNANFTITWMIIQSTPSGSVDSLYIDVNGNEYLVVYSKLQVLTNWVLMLFINPQDITFDFQIPINTITLSLQSEESQVYPIPLINNSTTPLNMTLSRRTPWVLLEGWGLKVDPGESGLLNLVFNTSGLAGSRSKHFSGVVTLLIRDGVSGDCVNENRDVKVEMRVVVPPSHLSIFPSIIFGTIVACSICAITPIVLAILIIKYQAHKRIKSASPSFCLGILFGALLLTISPIFLAFDLCSVWLWFFGIGQIFFFGAIIVKTYRLHLLLYNAEKLKLVVVTNSQLLPGIIFLVLLELILLITWQIVSPFTSMEILHTTQNIIFRECDTTGSSSGLFVMFVVQAIYSALLILAGCYFSFTTRKIKFENLKESSEILYAVYNYSVIFIVTCPLAVYFKQSSPNTFLIIVTIGTLLATTISSLSLFLLKFVAVFFKKDTVKLEVYVPNKSSTDSNKYQMSYE